MDRDLVINVGDVLRFGARLELNRAPRTCAAFVSALPFRARLVQERWSGKAAWIPLGDHDFGVPAENQTTRPAPGEILLYPAGISETEILSPDGEARFASSFGELPGNRFLTTVAGGAPFDELGRRVRWSGAQAVEFAMIDGAVRKPITSSR